MIHARARAKFGGLIAAVTASMAVLTSGPAVAAPARQPATTTLGTATTITLVTGDKVTLGGSQRVDVVPARGRERIGFHAHTDVDGDIHVIPADTMVLVSSGRLDPRLFNVTGLARSGYGDADRKDLPLIVDYPGATPRTAAGAQAVRELPSMSAVAMRADNHFLTMPLPYKLTEYYTPGTEWTPSFYDALSWDEFPPNGVLNNAAPRSYELGRTHKERWNVGPFGPAFPAGLPYQPYTNAARLGDEILFSVGMYSDQNPDTEGSTPTITSAKNQILRDGEVVAEQSSAGYIFAELPPDEAVYTARTAATMPGSLSTQIDGEWTFRSAHVTGDQPKPIPPLAVRFAPNLDDYNTAPAGKKFRFPVYVQRNGADRSGKVTTPAVEISYDDGQTWKKVRITRQHGQWEAEVNHPRNASSRHCAGRSPTPTATPASRPSSTPTH
jgi:hypothetical protein